MYVLKMYCDFNSSTNKDTIMQKYLKAIENRDIKLKEYFNSQKDDQLCQVDAGFDLFVPDDINIMPYTRNNKINYNIKCAMFYKNKLCAYHLYVRSSTGSKTPLRLSNSVGIIDAEYRGDIISVFDNNSDKMYVVKSGDRLVQICPPNLTYPIKVELVDNLDKLGFTKRNDCGFGSTGR